MPTNLPMPASATHQPDPDWRIKNLLNRKKKTKTEIFLEEEARLFEPCKEYFEEIKALLDRGNTEEARQKLNTLPYDVFEYAVEKEDPPKKTLRDCLNALIRWVFRAVEVNPNDTIESDLKLLKDTMNQKCKYC